MKRLFLLLSFNFAVFSQSMIFELKDCPSSQTYYLDGSVEIFTSKFYYNAEKQLIKIEDGFGYPNLTATYQKNGDTTIITTEMRKISDDESEIKILKQLHDNQGRVILELSYQDQKLETETGYYYNQDGDLIREVCKGSETDTTIYEWNLSELMVKATQKSSDNTILFYAEYKIDNSKKLIKSTYFLCDESFSEEILLYTDFSYNTPIKKTVSNRMLDVQKPGIMKLYAINGRKMSLNYNMANSVFIRKNNGKPVTRINLK